MSTNVGSIDRLLRAFIGIALIILPFVSSISILQGSTGTIVSVIVGAVLLGTSAFKFCPLYRVLGLRTCKL